MCDSCFEMISNLIYDKEKIWKDWRVDETKLLRLKEVCDLIDKFSEEQKIEGQSGMVDGKDKMIVIKLFSSDFVFDYDGDDFYEITKRTAAFGFRIEPGEDNMSAVFVFSGVWDI